MAYTVHELFYSFQGEGLYSGRPAVFCRFSGCNLWSGKEADRAKAQCRFCDTRFVGTAGQNGGIYADDAALVQRIVQLFPQQTQNRCAAGADTAPIGPQSPYVVFTGGEPALQLTAPLIALLHRHGLMVGIETNGSLPLPAGLDWICVSPKAGVPLAVKRGDELKLVWPQQGIQPEDFAHLNFGHLILQACDTGNVERNALHSRMVRDYCLANPHWRFGVQLHKLIGFQ